mmetsp:Transcript_16574/g.34589  ORF Transcript_16574/g.34589 Transcript_16574/m.34589 type:complete len:87 (-) Transcript_16574:563-823(-)
MVNSAISNETDDIDGHIRIESNRYLRITHRPYRSVPYRNFHRYSFLPSACRALAISRLVLCIGSPMTVKKSPSTDATNWPPMPWIP